MRDLYFGEALYHAFQGRYFDALQRLDTEVALYRSLDQPELDTLHYHIDNAEFSVGDFELNYRMHHRAGRAIKAVLEGAVDEAVRNEAAFRLARIHFQKDQLDDAQNALAWERWQWVVDTAGIEPAANEGATLGLGPAVTLELLSGLLRDAERLGDETLAKAVAVYQEQLLLVLAQQAGPVSEIAKATTRSSDGTRDNKPPSAHRKAAEGMRPRCSVPIRPGTSPSANSRAAAMVAQLPLTVVHGLAPLLVPLWFPPCDQAGRTPANSNSDCRTWAGQCRVDCAENACSTTGQGDLPLNDG